ncbi:uncharacterized protein LOC114174190 [Vigna unguiculata]|uniref:uncharacterized protein LOC114174190 n=1 Tax=Vigna unguiculata TaxID=3917 RepID=UPI0010164697|nr:uncharacterized protein LOC114174190 [Vigna unguiculata]
MNAIFTVSSEQNVNEGGADASYHFFLKFFCRHRVSRRSCSLLLRTPPQHLLFSFKEMFLLVESHLRFVGSHLRFSSAFFVTIFSSSSKHFLYSWKTIISSRKLFSQFTPKDKCYKCIRKCCTWRYLSIYSTKGRREKFVWQVLLYLFKKGSMMNLRKKNSGKGKNLGRWRTS